MYMFPKTFSIFWQFVSWGYRWSSWRKDWFIWQDDFWLLQQGCKECKSTWVERGQKHQASIHTNGIGLYIQSLYKLHLWISVSIGTDNSLDGWVAVWISFRCDCHAFVLDVFCCDCIAKTMLPMSTLCWSSMLKWFLVSIVHDVWSGFGKCINVECFTFPRCNFWCGERAVDDNIVFMIESLDIVVRHQSDSVSVIRFSTLVWIKLRLHLDRFEFVMDCWICVNVYH